MSYRSLNSTLQASLHGENTKVHSFGYAHLIKFEKPIPGTELTYSERTTPANKAINYTYLTDGAYDIKFNDGTSDASGNPNGEQNYLANKVLNVGTTSETIQAKSTTMSLKLAADSIGLSVTGVYGFTSTEITMSAGTTWVDQGFQEGDSVIFSGGVNNGQVVRIDSFTTSNTKIKYTPLPKDDGTLSSITASSTVTCTAKYHSAEINALTTLKSDPSFSSYLNREVFVYRAHINSDTGAVTGAPFLLFKGIITGGKLQEDPLKGSSITWSLTSHWGDFVQVKGRTTSDAGHRGLNTGGVTDEEAVFRPEYASDLAFRFADQAVNVAATYQVFEDKVRVEQSGGFFKGDLFSMDNTYIDKVPVDRDVDLAFNLKSRYLPVVYGVQKVSGIPFFADGFKDNAKIVYIASALCEGPIHSIMDLHVDDEPLICMNSADAAERTGESSEARVVCYGRSDKGDLLLGDSDRLDPSVLSQEQDILNELESYEPTSDSPISQIISQIFYADRVTELQVELGAVRDEINNFVGQASLTHEKKFNFNSPMRTQFTFHAGRSDQGSDANYTTIGGQGKFKLQSMYHTESANSNYWGPNHRALDTAYVAQVFTINAEEFTVPKTSYIVKGKVLDCFNYDRSYYGNKNPTDSSTTHADFQLGDYVKLFNHTSAQLNSGTNANETVQIIDKFLFYTDDGEPEYRYRFSKNLHLKEDNSNLSSDVSHFYMQHLTNSNKRWYFAAHDAHIVKADGSGLIRDLSLPTQQIFTNTSNSSIAFADATQGIVLKNGAGQNVAIKTMTGFPTNNAELAMGKYLTFSMNNGSQGGFMTPTNTFTIPYVTYNAATGTLSFPLESQALARSIENRLMQANLGIADSNITGAFWKIAVSDVVKLSGSISSDDDVYNRSRVIVKRVHSNGHISKYDKVIVDYDASESLVRVSRNAPFSFEQFPGTDSSSTYLFSIEGSIDVDTAAFNSLHGKGKDRRVSINPAIQLLDYLTNDRYGKGLDIDNDIDKESFLSAARFCDSRSDVTMIVKTSDLTTTPTDGSIYKYPASGSPILFQGTVKGTPITYDSVGEGDNSATGFTQIVFTDVIGQLGRKWNDYRSYDAGKHIIYHQGSAFMAGSTGTMNATTRDSRIANNTISSVTLTRVGTTGTGDSTIAINVEKKFGVAGNGNPVVRQFAAAGSNFKAMGYSLYDGDDCKYWKLLGWDDAEQRNVTRHQTNQIIDTSEPVFANVNAMLSQFNGMLRYGNGKYSLAVKQKAPTDAHFNTFSAKVINEEDIIGSISIDDGTSKKKLNQVNANIVDPSLRFGGRGITFTNSDYIKQDRGIKKEGNISVKGITNYFNARIAVKQLLDESRFGLTAKFTIDSSGYLLQAGDIIRINYSRFGWVNKNYRIQSLNFSPNGEVQVIAREHNEDAYTVEYVEDFINSNTSDGGSQGGRSFTAPGAPTSGSITTDQAGRVKLAWANGTEFVPTVQSTQVARHPSNVTPNAAGDNVTIIADTQQDNYIDAAPGDFSAGDITHYYWVRHTYSRNHGHTASVDRNKSTAWLALGQGTAKQTTVVEVEGGVTVQEGGLTFKDNPTGNPALKGGQTAYDTGTGFFLGYDTDAYKLSIGNSSGNKLTFDGTNLAVTGNITASSLTISSGASVTGSIPNTNVSGLGTASTQNSDAFATGAEGDLATSASQVNVGLALLTNKKLSAADATVVAGETGEALLCAVDKNGTPDHENDGFIQWEGNKITVERIQYTSGTTSGLSLLTGSENNKGFIVFDTAKGNPFIVNAVAMDIAFAWKIGTQWYYDNNTDDNTGTTFTPASTYVALGYLETASTHDNILRGGLFGQPIPLEQAAFPGDEQISGTIGGIKIDNEKIYAGNGNFFTADTGFYLKNDGDFSLSNKLKFDESADTLTVDGNITAQSLTLANSVTIGTGNLPSNVLNSNVAHTDVSGLGTAATQNSDAFATGAEGDLATSAAQPDDIRDLTFASKIGWNFESGKQSWTSDGDSNFTHNTGGYIVIDATDTDPVLFSPTGLALNGKLSTKVRASIRRTSGSGWHGALYYDINNGHGHEEANKHLISTDPTGGTSGTDWIIVEWDMANQSSGSTWTGSNTINQIRLDLGNTAADTFEVNWVAIGERGANALQEGADIQDGSAGGWTIEPDAIYTGTTKVTSGYNDNNQVTLNKDGGIHAKKFYIDASDGSAHFKGVIEGGSVKGNNLNSIPTDIFTRSTNRSNPVDNENGGFIDLENGYFMFGKVDKFITFGPDSEGTTKVDIKGDIVCDNLFAIESITTPLLKVGKLTSNSVGLAEIKEEVFSEIDTRLGNAGGYYDSYETKVGNSDVGYLGETTYSKLLDGAGASTAGYTHAGEKTFINFAMQDEFIAPKSTSQSGRTANDLKVKVTLQKAAAGTTSFSAIGAAETFSLAETTLSHASRFLADFSMTREITTDASTHAENSAYIYRALLEAVPQDETANPLVYKSMFSRYINADGTSGVGANDVNGTPVFLEIREGSIGSGAGNLSATDQIIHTGDNDTNIAFNEDQIVLNAGGVPMITVTEAVTDSITLHENVTTSKDLTVTGNLQVDGTTTTLNTTNLNVQDKNILLANGSANKAASDGAGITVDLGTNDPVTPDASLTYNQANNDWLMNKNLRIVTGASTGTLAVGREATTQYIKLHVQDTLNSIIAKQDTDENSDHTFILDREFAGTGASDFSIRKDGTDQLVINKTGYVGIGTSTPKQLLHVQDTSIGDEYTPSTYSNAIIEDADAYLEIVSNSEATWGSTILLKEHNVVAGDDNDTIDIWGISRQTKRIGDGTGANGKGDGSLRFTYGTANDNNTSSTKVAFASSGNVGIGTGSPHSLLHVDGGDLKISSDSATTGKGDGKPAIFFSENVADEVIAQISYHGDDETGDNNFIGIGCAGATATTQTLMKEIHQMVIKAGGNVGIGTTGPDFKLQIKTPAIPADSTYQWPLDLTRANNENRGLSFGIASAGTTTAIAGHNADVGIGHTYGDDTNSLPQYYETLTVKHVDETVGRVGIGHTNPSTPLHIHSFTNTTGTDTGTSFVTLEHDVGTSTSTGADLNQQKTFIDFIFNDDNTNETPQVRIGAEVGENADADSATKEGSGAFVVYTNDSDSTSGASSPAERFRVDYQGNVGIGATSPTGDLTIGRNGNASGGNIMLGSATNNTNKYGVITSNSYNSSTDTEGFTAIATQGISDTNLVTIGGGIGEVDSATQVRLYTSSATGTRTGTERMRIDSSGNVGIGTNNPNERLTVNLPVSLDSRYHSRAYTAGSFYLGNHDWYNFCVMSNGTKSYDATNQGMTITGYGHVRVPVRMPIDPKGTYRIKVRVKQISLTSGSPSFYCGVDTLNENLTTLSSDAATSYNYGVATNISLTAGTTYTFENYFTGYNATTGASTIAFDPEGKYFDVIILTNHSGNGVTCIQSLEVEKVSDTDALKRTKTISNQTETVLDFFNGNNYRSARFTVQVEHTIAGTAKYQTSEILVLHDGSAAYLTEYGMIETGGILATFDADYSSDQIRLKATVSDDFSDANTEDAKFTVIQHRVSV